MSIDNQEIIDKCKSKITVSFDTEKITEVVDEIAKNIGKHNKIAGFRKGRAPINAIKAVARKHILDMATQKLVSEAFEDVLFENDWKPFGQPKVENVNITYKNFCVDMTVGYVPEFELKNYDGIELNEPENIPTEEFIIERITDSLCEQNGTMQAFDDDDFLLIGDDAIISYIGKIDGEDFVGNSAEDIPLNIGANMAVDGFEDELIGMKVDETREFEITFPEDYKIEHLVSKTVNFNVKLNSASRKKKADIDEEFIKKLGFPTLDDLNTYIAQQAKAQIDNARLNSARGEILTKLVSNIEIDIPDWMAVEIAINLAKAQKMNWIDLDDTKKDELLNDSTHKLKLSFIFDKIKEVEMDTVLSNEEIMNIINANLGKFPEEIKKQLINQQNPQLLTQISSEVQDEHLIKWLIDRAVFIKPKEDLSSEETETNSIECSQT